MKKLSRINVLLIEDDHTTISIKNMIEDVAIANNSKDTKKILKIFFKNIQKLKHIELTIDLDSEYSKFSLQITFNDIIIQLGCLAENSYNDPFDDTEIELNTRKIWKYHHKTDKLNIDIPIGRFSVSKYLIVQFLLDLGLSVPAWFASTKEGTDNEMIHSLYYCTKRAHRKWQIAIKNDDNILRVSEMAALLFNELKEKGMKRPSDETKIAEWIRYAAKKHDILIPSEARKGGRPKK